MDKGDYVYGLHLNCVNQESGTTMEHLCEVLGYKYSIFHQSVTTCMNQFVEQLEIFLVYFGALNFSRTLLMSASSAEFFPCAI